MVAVIQSPATSWRSTRRHTWSASTGRGRRRVPRPSSGATTQKQGPRLTAGTPLFSLGWIGDSGFQARFTKEVLSPYVCTFIDTLLLIHGAVMERNDKIEWRMANKLGHDDAINGVGNGASVLVDVSAF